MFGRGSWGLVARRDIFLHVMVGGDGGVGRPKRNGWDWSAQSQTTGLTLLQHRTSPRSNHSFLPQSRNTRNLKWVYEGRPQLLLYKFPQGSSPKT